MMMMIFDCVHSVTWIAGAFQCCSKLLDDRNQYHSISLAQKRHHSISIETLMNQTDLTCQQTMTKIQVHCVHMFVFISRWRLEESKRSSGPENDSVTYMFPTPWWLCSSFICCRKTNITCEASHLTIESGGGCFSFCCWYLKLNGLPKHITDFNELLRPSLCWDCTFQVVLPWWNSSRTSGTLLETRRWWHPFPLGWLLLSTNHWSYMPTWVWRVHRSGLWKESEAIRDHQYRNGFTNTDSFPRSNKMKETHPRALVSCQEQNHHDIIINCHISRQFPKSKISEFEFWIRGLGLV